MSTREPPAIENQFEKLGWPFGFFTKPEPGDQGGATYFYNPSITRISDNKLLLAQRRTYWREKLHWRHLANHVLFSFLDPFDPELKPTLPEGIGWRKRSEGEQYDDPRLCTWNNQVILSMVCWDKQSHNPITQITLSKIGQNFEAIDPWHINYGGNALYPPQASDPRQKNWCPFPMSDGRLGVLYHHTPHTVLVFDGWRSPVTHYETPGVNLYRSWLFGEPRCSTPPVHLDGYYLTLFHSSIPAGPHKITGMRMRYHVGMILFDDNPPYRIRWVSPKPILSGSRLSLCPDGHPPCVFPGGLIMDHEKFEALVVAGINDAYSIWFKMDVDKVISGLKRYG